MLGIVAHRLGNVARMLESVAQGLGNVACGVETPAPASYGAPFNEAGEMLAYGDLRFGFAQHEGQMNSARLF